MKYIKKKTLNLTTKNKDLNFKLNFSLFNFI